jgi:hypothetical protein
VNHSPAEPGPAWELTDSERRQILALPARERYGLFLQLAVDWEEVWGLHGDDGWVLSSAGDGRDLLPLWPHPSFAAACARGGWAGTAAAAVPLEELLSDLLPILEEDGIAVAVFPNPDGEGVLVTPEELRHDLQAELELGEEGG